MILKKYLSIVFFSLIAFFLISCGNSSNSKGSSTDVIYIPFNSYLENLNSNTDDMILAAEESSLTTMPDLYNFLISIGFKHIQDYIDIYIDFKLYAIFNTEISSWKLL